MLSPDALILPRAQSNTVSPIGCATGKTISIYLFLSKNEHFSSTIGFNDVSDSPFSQEAISENQEFYGTRMNAWQLPIDLLILHCGTAYTGVSQGFSSCLLSHIL
jgi:hypothetical protein